MKNLRITTRRVAGLSGHPLTLGHADVRQFESKADLEALTDDELKEVLHILNLAIQTDVHNAIRSSYTGRWHLVDRFNPFIVPGTLWVNHDGATP